MSELNFIATLLIFIGSVGTALQAYRLQRLNHSIDILERANLESARELADHIKAQNDKALSGKRPRQLRWLWRSVFLVLLGSLLQVIVAYLQIG